MDGCIDYKNETMFHGKYTFSQSKALDFLKFSGGAWIPCLCYLVASFCIFLLVTLRLVSYCTKIFFIL